MKTIKSILVLSILLVSSISFAQPPGGGQRDGQQGPPPTPNNKEITKMVSDLADNLSLSEKQETKILDLYKDHFELVKEKTSGNNRPQREEIDALKVSLEKNVRAELTDKQITKYKTYLKKQNSQRPKR